MDDGGSGADPEAGGLGVRAQRLGDDGGGEREGGEARAAGGGADRGEQAGVGGDEQQPALA